MPRNLSDSFFGSIALKNKMLSREQLTQALRVQLERTRDEQGPTLGEVCRLLGFLRDDQVNAILWAQAKSEVLLEDSLTGSICLANKLVTQGQLDEALEDQRALDFTVRLGDLLCEKGYLDRQQLQAVLRAQVRIKTQAQKLKPVIVPPARPSAAAGWTAARSAKSGSSSSARLRALGAAAAAAAAATATPGRTKAPPLSGNGGARRGKAAVAASAAAKPTIGAAARGKPASAASARLKLAPAASVKTAPPASAKAGAKPLKKLAKQKARKSGKR